MSELPTGTVTFLFTDIEGSTRLLQQLGDAYATLVYEHHELLHELCEAHGGHVLDIQGDGFFVVFASAADALQVVIQAQRALAAHAWPGGVALRVRMGLHTGEPQISAVGYVGLDVHRAARIAAAGHGGQVLLSQTTYDLVQRELPEGVTVQDLGEHHLKDLREPKHLYQLIIPGLPSEFPPLKSLKVDIPNNLPVQMTSFIGRETELVEIRQLIEAQRLVTLIGPGGSGKTHLSIQVAGDLLTGFPDGVYFVPLAAISDPGLVPSAIAQVLGLSETAGRTPAESVLEHVRERQLLLVLDNFEQIVAAAPFVGELLVTGPRLKVVATSREGLHLRGEHEYAVPPLPLPSLAALPPPEALAHYAAVALFVQRAQAVRPTFTLTAEIAATVAQICHRLEGLPLAIELAAARIKLLPPKAMLAHLERRLEFLTSTARDLPARQQTLRNAIAWSYDLLTPEEQRLFRRMAVFVGGCTLEAARAIMAEASNPPGLLDELGSLLDKSLLRQTEAVEAEPRFVMLELLREFGLEQLEALGELEVSRARHARYFLALAEGAEAKLESAEQLGWIHRMELEHDNLRAALEWSKSAPGAGEVCLRLASCLGLFWEARGYFSEGREKLAAILKLPAAEDRTAARSRLLARAAELAYRQSDYPATLTYARESLAICRAENDGQGAASALIKLGNAATEAGDYATASGYLAEALTIWRRLKDSHGTARALISLGWAALRPGDYELAQARLEEALAISRELGDTRSIAFELSGLGEVALRTGAYEHATALLEESLMLRRQLGNKWGVGVSLGTLGWVAMHRQDWERAIARLGESLEVRQEIGDKGGSAWCLERLAEIAVARQQPARAVRLFGAAAALRESLGSVIDPVDRAEHEDRIDGLRTELGELRFTEAWQAGRALSLPEAAAYALEP